MEDLSLHILDIAENAIAACASRIRIEIREDTRHDILTLEVSDNGRGMDAGALENVLDPFFTTRTTRRIGLGLPLLEQAAKAANGAMTIKSTPGVGTVVNATFQRSHVDRQPIGNIAATITTLIARSPDIEFIYVHTRDGHTVSLTTEEMKKHLDGIAVNSAGVLSYVMNYLSQEEATLDHNT
jgi:anti-sigma regulatory factor (Ser/Thr protein kinase)